MGLEAAGFVSVRIGREPWAECVSEEYHMDMDAETRVLLLQATDKHILPADQERGTGQHFLIALV